MTPVDIDQLRVVLNAETRLVMAFILFGMMFTVALSLKPSDFTAVARDPFHVLGGAIAQILGLPILTLGLIQLINPPASVALGMIIVACCPGGTMSNVLTHFGRGDTAYSVSLTTVSSVSAALVTPVSIMFWSGLYLPTSNLVQSLDVDPFAFVSQTFALLAMPLALGMILAWKTPVFAERLRSILTPVALALLIGLIVFGVWSNWGIVLAAGALIVPLAILHNFSAFLLGAGAARALAVGPARRRSLTFEVGIQNAGLGLLILLNQFDGLGGAAAITAWWSVWHLIAGGMLVLGFRAIDTHNKKSVDTGSMS